MEWRTVPSRNRNRRTITAVLMGLWFSVGLPAQQKDEKPTPEKRLAIETKADIDTESAEHKFARQRYEELKLQYDPLMSAYDKTLAQRWNAQSLGNKAKSQGKTEEWYALLREQLKYTTYALALNQKIEPIAADLALWKERLTHADDCSQVFHDTIDKKSSDLTVREADLIAGCKSLDLYPPHR